MPAPTTGQVILDSAGTPVPLLLVVGTYSKGDSSPLYAQQIRLGDPIDLGPQSTWRQNSFIGGVGQEKWADSQMWFLGDVDARFGYMQCNYTLTKASGSVGDNREKVSDMRAKDTATLPHLYFAGVGDTVLKRRDTLTGGVTNVFTFPAGISAIGRSFYNSQFGLHIGLQNGALYEIPGGSETVGTRPSIDTGVTNITFLSSLGAKGDIAGTGNRLYRWVTSKWLLFAGLDMNVIDGVPWNQRLFFIGADGRNLSRLYVTDTTTTQDVYTFPSGFQAKSIALHNGTIYVLGVTWNDEFTKVVGQLWSYNGQSMRLLYTVPDELSDFGSFTAWPFMRAAAYHQWLAFGFPHRGVYYYDPEQDAIFPGPKLAGVTDDTGNYVSDLTVFGGRLVAANYNETGYHYEPNPRTFVNSTYISSEYDAGLPGQEKVWTEIRVRFKEPLATGATVDIYVTTQHVESDAAIEPKWIQIGTVTSGEPGRGFHAGRRIANGNIIGGGVFTDFRSEVLRVKLVLKPNNTNPGNISPKVEGIEVDYFVINPLKRSWSFQAICAGATGDKLTRPDGTAYQYTAAQLETALNLLRIDTVKQFFEFTDKDGATYNVKFTGFTQYERVVAPDNPDGEVSLFAMTLAEV